MQVTTSTLKDPGTALIALDEADAKQRAEIARRAAEIDITSTQSIVKFGSKAQEDLVAVSDQMLEGVRNKDVGPAGDALRKMVTTIRGFEVDAFDDGKGGIWDWFASLFSSAVDFQERFNTVKGQIDRVTDELLEHETVLLRDIKSLDKLYEKSVEYYDELALYIAAGAMKLVELDGTVIPAKEAEVQAASESDQMKKSQELRDLRQARDDLERRVHDLKLTRQVTMQSLPSIRLVQENDKGLVAKINSTIVNTVPLWRTQLAQAIAIQNAREAAGDIKAATDLTDDLLRKNADTLRETNREVREQMERGVVDIEALKHSHSQLIATIEETLQIAEEGKAKRAVAEQEMIKMEAELRTKLAAATASKAAQDASAAIEGKK
ncbi:MAG: toxic anion resistance protein [Neomegalonema sp.]|nr:toxic anion resistance protein [Neomegalonema sp.]